MVRVRSSLEETDEVEGIIVIDGDSPVELRTMLEQYPNVDGVFKRAVVLRTLEKFE